MITNLKASPEHYSLDGDLFVWGHILDMNWVETGDHNECLHGYEHDC